MANVSKRILQITMLWLILFHTVFFYKFYAKPFQLATSELLSTFFPTWVWQGREWSKWRIPKYEPCFWLNAHAHPVLSTYYPIHVVSSVFGNFFRLDTAFKIFVYEILGHYLFSSIGWFLLLRGHFNNGIALFGAITFAYQAYHIKQQPCIVYTLAWFPWIAFCPWLAIGMILLSGYYPLALYLLPLGLFLNHDPVQWIPGFLIGSIQILPFLRYLPKTIRSMKSASVEVGFWEKSFYFGLTPIFLLILHFKMAYLACFLPVLASFTIKQYLPRIHQRMWLLGAYIAIFCSLESLSYYGTMPIVLLIILQSLDLYIFNSGLLPTRPYCELYKKPSLAFKYNSLVKYLEKNLGKDNRVSGLPWPLFTGIINSFKTLGYSGGMQLKLMAKWRHDSSPNGSGEHDYFRSNTDNDSIKRYRVQFAYTGKKLHWTLTPVKHLFRNPSLS